MWQTVTVLSWMFIVKSSMDGPAKVHVMVPGTCGTFEDYVNHMWWRNWTLSFEAILHGIFTSPTAWKMQRDRREAVALVVGFHPPQEFQATPAIPARLSSRQRKQTGVVSLLCREMCFCGPNVRYHQWTSMCRCSMALSLRVRKHSSNRISSIRTYGESRIPSRPHLGSVPRQATCSHARWLGLGEVWWTMESCMDHTSWGRQGFYYDCSAASARRPARETASVRGQYLQCTSLNHCTLAMDIAMETELTARPDTNRGLHYMSTYMMATILDSNTQLHVLFTWKGWSFVLLF